MSSCKILYIDVGVRVGWGWGLEGLPEPAGMPLVGLERVNSRMSSTTTLCGHLTTSLSIHIVYVCVRRLASPLQRRLGDDNLSRVSRSFFFFFFFLAHFVQIRNCFFLLLLSFFVTKSRLCLVLLHEKANLTS